MKVSELLVRSLESYGVTRAFGLVGTSILELMDALSSSRIRYVSTRHEQVAVSMADAEGRLTGKPGVAMVHGGPGFLNSLISVTNAWKDGSPMVLVAGAVKRRMVGMDSWLEVPESTMIAGVVKRAWRVERGSEAARIFAEAYSLAGSAPYGPTFVEVPEDVWNLEAGSEVIGIGMRTARAPTEAEVASAAELLARAKKPLIVVGGGINSPEGAEALRGLLSRVEVPVVSSGNGRGAVPEDSPFVLGRIGFGGGNRTADSTLVEADAVLCVGCGLSDVSTYGFNLTPKGEVVVADLDPLWDKKPVPCAMHAACDATEFVRSLTRVASPRRLEAGWWTQIESDRKGWDAILKEAESRTKVGFVNPAKFLRALDSRLPRDAILAVGQGLHVLYAYSFLKVRSSRSFLAATNMGSMGFVFPAAVGAKMVFPERETVGVMGDGEFMMTIQDLETAVREKVGVKVVIVNDNSYRVLLMRQKIQKMGRIFGTTHSNPDFVRVAEAFGTEGLVIDSDDEVREGVEFLSRESNLPLLVELRVDPEDLPPLNVQGSLMF
ncbi:MAG TPA: thiamine pyrophosphate-binding protein [Nitrososphaerales archaeon]|nr:thiamine pyrophosphate-binding protein [Nitrososphaerales archaeon]